jgi:hypothetical protein
MADNALAPRPVNAMGGWPTFPTATERFLKSRDTSWADKFGGVTPYYPQQRYIDQNLAPDLGITNMQLEALAQANQIARKNKLMSPKLLDAIGRRGVWNPRLGLPGHAGVSSYTR